MNLVRILLFLISFSIYSQTDSLKINKKKNYFVKDIFLVGDVFGLSKSLFTNQTKISAMTTFRFHKSLHAVMEAGYHSGTYDKLNWEVTGKGIYIKPGVLYFFSEDHQNKNNGFYTGLKLGFANFYQTIHQFPIYGQEFNNQTVKISYGSNPTEQIAVLFFEIPLGARVQLGKSKFYLQSELQTKVNISDKNSEGIESLFIPGVGKNNASINFDLFAGIGYEF